MTDEDFKKELGAGLKNTIEGEPYVKEKLLIYLEHVKESKKKGTNPRSPAFVEDLLIKHFHGKWTPRRTAIRTWVEKNMKPEKGNGKQ